MYINKKKICHIENLKLIRLKLSFHSFGNVSIRINENQFTIKPSGVDLYKTDYKKYPLIDIDNKNKIKNNLKPSVDTEIHRQIYLSDKKIKSIAHSHCIYATSFSQANLNIPILGTTHADYFSDKILITKKLSKTEVNKNYEKNIGKSIIQCIKKNKKNFNNTRAILLNNHGPFTWGYEYEESVKNMEILEYIALLAFKTLTLNKKPKIHKFLIDKHFNRKHGKKSYYGQ